KGLEHDQVFDMFSFIKEINYVKEHYEFIDDIKVLNIGGLALGDGSYKLAGENREIFNQVLEDKDTIELEVEETTYRYIYYESPISEGRISKKVIEIAYNHNKSDKIISNSFNMLILQLGVILLSLIFIAFIIYYWISKQLYHAKHDSLTGLYNRLSFDVMLSKLAQSKNHSTLLMIDLDNFKQINDMYGHNEGDQALRLVAQTLKRLFK